MTEQLTSPSSYSINQYALRLNTSSGYMISPSQSNFNSDLKNNLIVFEQFTCREQNKENRENEQKQVKKCNVGNAVSLGIGKKKLTIQIDESYECAQQNNVDLKQKVDKSKNKNLQFSQKQKKEEQQSGVDGLEMVSPVQSKTIAKYYELLDKIKETQNKMEIAEQIIKAQKYQIQAKEEHAHKLEQRNSHFQYQLTIKNTELGAKNTKIQFLEEKLKQKQQQNVKLKLQAQQKNMKASESHYSDIFVEELERKLRQLDIKAKQLKLINEKLTQMNKNLIKQVKLSDKKVRDLQKQLQNNLCFTTQENLHRLRESSIKLKQKQNERYNGSYSHTHINTKQRDSVHLNKQVSFAATFVGRKSLQKKKGSTNTIGLLLQSKKPRIGSSSSSNTILNKKLMHK